MIPSIGRTVHFVLPSGEHRPAIIVRIWDGQPTEHTVVQLQVFIDGSNDAGDLCDGERAVLPPVSAVWRTSVHQDTETKAPGTWHEPERV